MNLLFLFLLWLIVLVTWRVEKSRTGYRLGPVTVLLLTLVSTPTLFLAPGIEIYKQTPNTTGYLVYLGGVASCSLGYILSGSRNVGNKRQLPFKIYKTILYISMFFAVISLLLGFYQMVKYGFFSSEVSGEEAYAAKASASDEGGGTIGFAITTLTGSFRSISGFSLIILLLAFKRELGSGIRFIGWSIALFWIFVQFASLSRGALIYPILTMVLLVYNFNRAVPWGKIIKAGLSIAIILVVLTLVRTTKDQYIGRTYSHPGVEITYPFWTPNIFTWITETIIYYQAHPFGNFGEIIDHDYDFAPSFGHETLRGSSFALRFLAPSSIYRIAAENAQTNQIARLRHGLFRQWSTWFGSIFQSFGYIGVPIISFLSGLFLSKAQRFSQIEGGATERMFFAATTMIAFSASSVYFLGSVGGFGLFAFCLLIYAYIKKQRLSGI